MAIRPAIWGVPLVLQPTRIIDDNLKVSRATVQAVYDQIIDDLEFARDNLPPWNNGGVCQ